MTYDELVAKKEELELKIEKLNEQLRFGSSGNISGVQALGKMKENLKLVNEALANTEAPAPEAAPEPEAAPQPQASPEPAPQQQPPAATAPPAPPADGDVVETPQEEQLGTS